MGELLNGVGGGEGDSAVYRWMEESNWVAAYLSWTVEPDQKKSHMERVHDLCSSAYTMSSGKPGRPLEFAYSSLVLNKTYLHFFLGGGLSERKVNFDLYK